MISLKDAVNLFVEHKEAEGIRHSTIEGYLQHLRIFMRGMPPGCLLADVKPSHVIAFVTNEKKRGMADATVKSRDRTLDIFFTWCEDNIDVRSPIRNAQGKRLFKAPKMREKEPKCANDAQIDGLLLSIPKGNWMDLRDRAIVSLMRDTGIRVGETMQLDVTDVDCERNLVTVRISKNGKPRSVPFTTDTARAVKAYLMMRPWCPPAAAAALFVGATNYHGTVEARFSDWGIRQMLKRRCENAQMEYVNPHSIRHLFAVRALNSGIRAEVVSKMMGHHSVDFTLRYYATLLTETIQREYNERW